MSTFDEMLRAELANVAHLGPDGQQAARDLAARRFNAQNGRGSGFTSVHPQRNAPQEQTNAPVAANAPIPTARPAPSMEDAIAAQLGDNVPVPTARPNHNVVTADGLEGDAGAMEQIAATRARSPVETAIADAEVANGTAEEAASLPTDEIIVDETATAGPNADPTALIAIVTALGGTAGVAALIERYNAGDPDAARTFQAIGMSPDDLSMFAGEPTSAYDNRQGRLPAPDRQIADQRVQEAHEVVPRQRVQAPSRRVGPVQGNEGARVRARVKVPIK